MFYSWTVQSRYFLRSDMRDPYVFLAWESEVDISTSQTVSILPKWHIAQQSE